MPPERSPLPTDQPQAPRPATLAEGLDQLADEVAKAASTLRHLLARGSLFEEHGYAKWQLLSVLNSFGLHEGTVRQLRRLVDRASNGSERQ